MYYPHVNHQKKTQKFSGEGVLDRCFLKEGVLDRCFLKEGALGRPQCQDQGEVLY